MTIARIIPRSFGDMLPDPYDLVRSPAVRAVTAAAQENGCAHADYDTVYKHMRTHRFTKLNRVVPLQFAPPGPEDKYAECIGRPIPDDCPLPKAEEASDGK